MAAVQPPQAVDTIINYYDGVTKFIYPGTAGDKIREHEGHPVTVTDLRGQEDQFNLDANGFQFVAYETKENAFGDAQRVKKEVYNETAELLKKVTGATHVHVFSHIIREHTIQTAMKAARAAKNSSEVLQQISPAMYCHIDQSDDGAAMILEDNLPPPDAERLGKSRWAIINVWRPMYSTVKRDPLAVCDARSVSDGDLVPVGTLLPDKGSGLYGEISNARRQEVLHVRANPSHRWYYASEMTPGEALMIKCFDSKRDGRARRAPHSAIVLPGTLDRPPRESIEARCLVFWEDQTTE